VGICNGVLRPINIGSSAGDIRHEVADDSMHENRCSTFGSSRFGHVAPEHSYKREVGNI